MNSFFLTPEQLGFTRCKIEDLIGGTPGENAQIALSILNGRKGPQRDIVLLNSALCLYMGHGQQTLRDCIKMAAEIIDSGRAREQLNLFVRLSNGVAQ